MKTVPLSQTSGKLIVLVTTLTSGISFLLGSALTIALPAFQNAFDASLATVQWIYTAYMLPLSALILLSGALGDRFGLKKIFLTGQIIFTIALFLSGVATSSLMLIVFQGLLGIGAALMIPGSLAILKNTIHNNQQGQAIGIWAGLSGALAALGPFIGGFLVETFSWRYLFFAIFPLMLFTSFLSFRYIPIFPTKKTPLDILGAFFLSIGLFLFSFGLLQGSEKGFSDLYVLFSLLLGVILLCVFAFYEKHKKHPLLPFSIFESKKVLIANINTLAIYSGLSGIFFFLSILLQQFYSLTGTLAGLAILPATAIIAIFSSLSGKYTDSHGERTQMIIGPLLLTLGIGLLLLVSQTFSYWTIIFPGLLLFGFGMVIVIPAITRSALSVSSDLTGTASGVNNAVSRFAGLVAVAVFGTLLSFVFQAQLPDRIESTSLTTAQKELVLSQKSAVLGITLPETLSENTKEQVQSAIDHSFLFAFRMSLTVPLFLAFLSFLVSLLFFPKRSKDKK